MNINYPSIAKFAEFVQLKDYRVPTKKEYVRYLLRFADHLKRDPATASEDDVRRKGVRACFENGSFILRRAA